MAYFYAYGELAVIAATTETALPGATVTIALGHRAVVHRLHGSTLETVNARIHLCQTAIGAANHLLTVARVGVGEMGGECFVFVDARAAAVVLLLSAWETTGNLLITGDMSGYHVRG